MKIKPVILCGGEGTRLWPKSKKINPKQFIDFGGWNLFQKTIQRIKNPIFDNPIISTNMLYLKLVKKHLSKNKIRKYHIILEPIKRNTAPAILSSALINNVSYNQPMIFFPCDHLIDKTNTFFKFLQSNRKHLNEENIFIFGIKPNYPSSQYGYFLTKKTGKHLNKVTRFIEKPNLSKAKLIVKKKGSWNSGILFAKKSSILNHFRKHQSFILKNCIDSFRKSKIKNKVFYLNKKNFKKIKPISFDYAILEKSKNVYGININIPWSDLGSWKDILNVFEKNKKIYFKRKNVFYRPWGKYINLFKGNGFLIKELSINSNSSISLQKHRHRSEYWNVISGKPKITLNKKKFFTKANDFIHIPKGAIHRIENLYKKPVKIMEVQSGAILKETDIVRYKDVYGRIS